MFKPQGNSLKAYENGRKARRERKAMSENPNVYGPSQILAFWWDKGWNDEDKEGGKK
jgi:hypothetical protein